MTGQISVPQCSEILPCFPENNYLFPEMVKVGTTLFDPIFSASPGEINTGLLGKHKTRFPG
jgi:hypothetical protein